MTSGVLSFSMSIGVMALALVCTLLTMMPPMDLKWVAGLLSTPVWITTALSYLLRNVR